MDKDQEIYKEISFLLHQSKDKFTKLKFTAKTRSKGIIQCKMTNKSSYQLVSVVSLLLHLKLLSRDIFFPTNKNNKINTKIR